MLFNSFEFLVFFMVVFAAYWAVPSRGARVILLLCASYYFYMSWNAWLAAVVAGSSLVDYFLARALERSGEPRRRKAFLVASIVMNMGLLFYFKYMNFFLQSLGDLLRGAGLNAQMPVLKIILPIGISFYTFEAISYMTDVYTRRAVAEKNPLHFLLFITFFPRMIAGPIIRARNFLPQLKREKHFDWPRFRLGFELVAMGLFKKIAIADRMSNLVDPVYASPGKYSSGATWIAVVAYSLQVYGDFSGYSDIAIGTAHMLGFKLPQNFNMPYIARNIADFWRRWHISLSTWLRDYLFLPLGGSRGTELKTAATLFITMTLCGLWHGAKWTLVGFGMVQGVMMITHRLFRKWSKNQPRLSAFLEAPGGIALRIAFTYWTFIVSLVVFRAPDFASVGTVFSRLFVPHSGGMVRHPVGPWSLISAFLILAGCHYGVARGLWEKIYPKLTPLMWGFGCSSLLVLIFLMRTTAQKAFIYFQF